MVYSRIKQIIVILILSLAVVFAAVNIVPIENGYIYTDSLYSSIYLNNEGEYETLISKPGVGRFFTISPDNKYIGIKYREIPGGVEAPALLEIETSKLIKLHDDVLFAGQVSFSDDGKIAYAIDNKLYIKHDKLVDVLDLGTYANIAPISPNGEKVVFNDVNDQLWVIDLMSKEKIQITQDKYGTGFPQWSYDSRYISYQSFDGHVKIYDDKNKNSVDLGQGGDLRWAKNEATYAFTKVNLKNNLEMESTQVIYSKMDGETLYLSEPRYNEKLAFIDKNGELNVIRNNRLQVANENLSLFKKVSKNTNYPINPIVFETESVSADTFLTVPYVNQVYDTPGERGYSSCAPTTASMVLAYYNLIPKWPFVSGWGNLSNYGAYVHERYYYNDNYFDQTYTDCNSSHSYCYTCYGGMGYMWTGGSPNSRMAGYYQKHGLSTHQTWSTNWTTVRNEIDKKEPFTICNYLSGSGHVIVALGRVSNGQRTVIVNDPYGNRNLSSWPNYYGAAVRYDWPGYNHGHASLNYANSSYTLMPWCIATSYAQPTYPDSIVDDKQFDNGFYIKAEGNTVPMRFYHSTKSGYGGHHWWSYSEENESDQCYVSWTPNVDSAAYYEIFAYIPASATATQAFYRINHAAGKSKVSLDQSAYSDEWVSLGKYFFRIDGSDYVYLGDSTGIGSQKIAFDAMKWDLVEVENLGFTSDYTQGYPGFEIKFWVNSPVSEGNYTYTWDFGDGNSAEGDTVIYAYADTGSFDILLTAQTSGINFSEEKKSFIKINSNDGELTLLYPSQHSIIQTARPILSWNDVLGKLPAFHVYLSLSPEFNDTLYQDETFDNYCKVLSDLPENKNIYWQVKLSASSETGAENAPSVIKNNFSNVGVFSVNAENSVPMDFDLIAPENEFISDTLRPVFSWNTTKDKDPGDSLTYKLYIGISKDSMNCIYTGSENSYHLESDLLENAYYYWYVEANDRSQASKRSKESYRVFSVNTINEAPPAPIQLAPNANSYQTTRYPNFSWTAVQDPDPGDEVTYKLYYWYEGAIITYSLTTANTSSDERRFGDHREYFWTVAAIDKAGLMTFSDTLNMFVDTELDVLEIPAEFSLNGNYPNPFNPLTKISYSVPNTEKVNISLFDLSGKLISTLFNDVQNPGNHYIELDATNLPSGIYIYKMMAGDFNSSSKMLLLK